MQVSASSLESLYERVWNAYSEERVESPSSRRNRPLPRTPDRMSDPRQFKSPNSTTSYDTLEYWNSPLSSEAAKDYLSPSFYSPLPDDNRPSIPPYAPSDNLSVHIAYDTQSAYTRSVYDADPYGGVEQAAAEPVAGPSADVIRRPSDLLTAIRNYDGDNQEDFEEEYWEDEEYADDPSRFVNFSLLSHIAVQMRDKVPRGTHVKGSIPYPRAFTGKDIVSSIQSLIQRELAINHGVSTNDRRAALQVAQSLKTQLFFYEVEWGDRPLQDGVEDVYMFLDDQQGGSDSLPIETELPTGVVTALTRCYVPSCGDGGACYSPRCPRNGDTVIGSLPATDSVRALRGTSWSETVPREVLDSLPESEINRQTCATLNSNNTA